MTTLPVNLFSDDEKVGLTGLRLFRGSSSSLKTGAGVLIQDSMNRRLIEAASIHLGLVPTFLIEDALDFEVLSELELIVADSAAAHTVRAFISARSWYGDGLSPAVIAAVPPDRKPADPAGAADLAFDGVLHLPQAPAPLAMQLGLMLYAHRAYARRYYTAVEELHLNRRIFRSLTSGVTVSDALLPDLPLTYVNPAFEAMTGYQLEEVRGHNCRFLQGEERNQPGLEAIRRSLNGRSEETAVLHNYRKDGTPFWNEVTISPIRNRDGVLTHFIGIQNDVTVRVEYEAKIREAEKLAVVGRLASSIAHEINNPLEAVMNLVYIASSNECSAEMQNYLKQMDRELQRVKLITSRSLRFYKQSTNARAMDYGELLDSVLNLNESRLLNFQIKVERRDRLHRSIVCMESEIRQVLNNLVGNAIDAMPGVGGRLFLRSREATNWRSGQRGILLTIADTGFGMNAETLKKLYKAFFTTKGIGGSGLGLWISSEIVERHHGQLRVRSRKVVGTVFTLFLPNRDEDRVR